VNRLYQSSNLSDRLYNYKTQQAISLKQDIPDRLKYHLKICDLIYSDKTQQAIAFNRLNDYGFGDRFVLADFGG
jgi:hypothetical protein